MASSVSVRRWESKSALLAHLEASEARTLVIGFDAEAPRAYYSFSVASGHAEIEIGVIASGLGSEPAAVVLDKDRRVLLGHDTSITWIDLEPLAVASSRRLGGVFFEFLPVDSDDEIVILHELGALRVDANGAVKWSVDTDIVEDSRIDATGNLILTAMDGPKLVVSLVSGVVSR